jgi:hypothetical protein
MLVCVYQLAQHYIAKDHKIILNVSAVLNHEADKLYYFLMTQSIFLQFVMPVLFSASVEYHTYSETSLC